MCQPRSFRFAPPTFHPKRSSSCFANNLLNKALRSKLCLLGHNIIVKHYNTPCHASLYRSTSCWSWHRTNMQMQPRLERGPKQLHLLQAPSEYLFGGWKHVSILPGTQGKMHLFLSSPCSGFSLALWHDGQCTCYLMLHRGHVLKVLFKNVFVHLSFETCRARHSS